MPDISTLPVLDRETLNGLNDMVGGAADPEFVNELVRDFLRDADLLIRVIGGPAADRPARRRAAHSLKSTSAMLGARRLSRVAEDLEHHIIDGSTASGWQEIGETLNSELDRVRSEFGE